MVGPGARKSSVGEGIESRRPLFCSGITTLHSLYYIFFSPSFSHLHLFWCVSIIIIICARERLVSAHLSRFSGKDGNHLQGCCSQQYEEGDILGCSWRRERNATATGEQCPLELLEKLTGCRSVTLPSPRHEQPKMSPYSPLQMVPIFPGETGEVNLRFAGDFFFTSGLQQRHTEQNGSPRQDALEHISRPRSSTHDKEAPLKLVTMPTL